MFAIILEKLYTSENTNALQDLNISTEEHFKKQVLNPFDFQIIFIEESTDPDINSFNNKSEAVDSPYFSINEFNSSS